MMDDGWWKRWTCAKSYLFVRVHHSSGEAEPPAVLRGFKPSHVPFQDKPLAPLKWLTCTGWCWEKQTQQERELHNHVSRYKKFMKLTPLGISFRLRWLNEAFSLWLGSNSVCLWKDRVRVKQANKRAEEDGARRGEKRGKRGKWEEEKNFKHYTTTEQTAHRQRKKKEK